MKKRRRLTEPVIKNNLDAIERVQDDTKQRYVFYLEYKDEELIT